MRIALLACLSLAALGALWDVAGSPRERARSGAEAPAETAVDLLPDWEDGVPGARDAGGPGLTGGPCLTGGWGPAPAALEGWRDWRSPADDDPWQPGAPVGRRTRSQPTAPAAPSPWGGSPRTWRHARPDGRGGLAIAGGTPRRTAPPADVRLVTYDLRAMAPCDAIQLEPLQGQAFSELAAMASPWESSAVWEPTAWWQDLAAALVARVGETRWPEDTTLLAWDEGRRLLLVQQTEASLRLVERVLDEWDARGQRVVPIHVEIQAGEAPVQRYELHVPRWREVRAGAGTATVLVADYDVECSMDCWLADPILQPFECGLGIAATRYGTGGHDRLHFAVAWAPGPLRPASLECEGLVVDPGRTFTLEWCPGNRAHTGAGAFAPGDDARECVRLGPDVHARLYLGAEPVTRAPFARTWRVAAQEPGATAQAPRYRLRLFGDVSGRLGAGRLAFDGRHSVRIHRWRHAKIAGTEGG